MAFDLHPPSVRPNRRAKVPLPASRCLAGLFIARWLGRFWFAVSQHGRSSPVDNQFARRFIPLAGIAGVTQLLPKWSGGLLICAPSLCRQLDFTPIETALAMRFRFTLLTLLLVFMAIAVVIVLTFRLPVNSFAFDRETGDHFRPLMPQELVVRLLTFGVLTAIMLTGIMLAIREFSRLNRR
jgi:hypothetical protein